MPIAVTFSGPHTVELAQEPECRPERDKVRLRLRLMHTIMRLATEGKLSLRPIISHIVPVDQAPALFQTLDEHPERVLQAVLEFPR